MSFISSEGSSTNGTSSHEDETDSIFPEAGFSDAEVKFSRNNGNGEDLGDALWQAKFHVNKPGNEDEGDDSSLVLSKSNLETIIANQIFDEIQFVVDDDDDEHAGGRHRHSIGELNGIFTLTSTLKRVPSLMHSETSKIKKLLTKSPVYDPFTGKSGLMMLLTLLLDLSDYGTDVMVATLLVNETSTQWWFNLTLMLILVPLFLVNLFSIFWFWQDHRTKPDEIRRNAIYGRGVGLYPHHHKLSKTERRLIIGSHIFFLAPLFRHFQIFYCGWQERKLRHLLRNVESRKNPLKRHAKIEGPYCINPHWETRQDGHLDYYTLRKYYERDAAYLGLIKAFLQDCPQLILQLYILAVRDHKTLNEPSIAFYQISSVIISLMSLSWSMVCYEQSNRWANPDKPQMTMAGCVIQLFWRFFMVASRVIVLALFATCFRLELFTFLGLHWLLMTLWILMMGTNFCGSAENRRRPLSELLYNIVMGFVGIFEYLHLKDGPTRLKYIFFYSLTLVEASALMTLWYLDTTRKDLQLGDEPPVPWGQEDWYIWGSLFIVPSFYLIGIIFMMIYYKWYHPGGSMPDRGQRASLF